MSLAPTHKPVLLRHRLEILIMKAWLSIFRLLPRPWHVPFIQTVCHVWYYLVPLRRTLVLENLRRAFPQSTPAWRRRRAIASLAHFTRMGLEFWPLADPEKGAQMVARMVDGTEHEEYYEQAGGTDSPFIFVSAHLGHWELMMSWYAAFRGQKAAVLAKPLHNPLVERMVGQVRAARGYEVIHTRGDLRGMLRAVRQGKTLAFLVDQDARRQGVFVDFFGKPAATFTGPAFLAHRLGLPILVGACVRTTPDGRYTMRFLAPIQPDPKADRDTEVLRLTQDITKRLEDLIRHSPDQYFWFHNRWKTRPKTKKHSPPQDAA